MPLVKVKTKYQITIPTAVREQVGVALGDLLEAKVEKGKITLTPKSVIDRGIAEGLEDIKQGRVSPTFSSAHSAVRYLHRQAKKLKTKE
jgi:AbrB family looped-hinge helix DNA binding protein